MTQPEIDRLDAPEAVALFTEFGAYERHFNDMQGRYRALASTWLLGAIAAIGFILTHDLQLSVERSLLVTAIAVAAAFGVTLLWHLDLVVYHALLHAAFLAGLVLEEEHPQIPPMRGLMLANERGDAAPRIVYFYLGCTGAPLVTALIAVAVAAFGGLPSGWAVLLVIVAFSVGIGWLWFMFERTKSKSVMPDEEERGASTWREFAKCRVLEPD